MRKDNSYVPQTCPMIDQVIRMVNHAANSEEPMSGSENNEIEKLMENIRSANSDLRDWGNGKYNEAYEFEKDNDSLKDQVSELEQEIKRLKEEVKDLEEQLSAVEG